MNNKLIVGLLSVLVVIQLVVGVAVLRSPRVFVGPQGPRGPQGEQGFGATPSEQITNWVGGAFSGDVSVGGDFTVTGTSTFSGALAGVPKVYSAALSSATTTCSVRNTSGASRLILSIGAIYASTTAPNVGTFSLVAGTSTNAYGTSTSPLINAFFTTVNGTDVYTTTSTVNGTAGIEALWRPLEYITWKSGTTTSAGTCKLLYY